MKRVLSAATVLMVATLLAALVIQTPQALAKKPTMGSVHSGKSLRCREWLQQVPGANLKGSAGLSPNITSYG